MSHESPRYLRWVLLLLWACCSLAQDSWPEFHMPNMTNVTGYELRINRIKQEYSQNRDRAPMDSNVKLTQDLLQELLQNTLGQPEIDAVKSIIEILQTSGVIEIHPEKLGMLEIMAISEQIMKLQERYSMSGGAGMLKGFGVMIPNFNEGMGGGGEFEQAAAPPLPSPSQPRQEFRRLEEQGPSKEESRRLQGLFYEYNPCYDTLQGCDEEDFKATLHRLRSIKVMQLLRSALEYVAKLWDVYVRVGEARGTVEDTRTEMRKQIVEEVHRRADEYGLTGDEVLMYAEQLGIILPSGPNSTWAMIADEGIDLQEIISNITARANSTEGLDLVLRDVASNLLRRKINVEIPQDMKTAFEGFEEQLTRVTQNQLEKRVSTMPQDVEDNIYRNITNVTATVQNVVNRLESLNVAEALRQGTLLLVKVEEYQNGTMIINQTLPQFDIWRAIVTFDIGSDMSDPRRSFEVSLRNNSILIGLVEMEKYNGKPMKDLDYKYLQGLVADNAIDMNEVRHVLRRIKELNKTYDLNDLAKVMVAIEDFYGVQAFRQVQNNEEAHRGDGEWANSVRETVTNKINSNSTTQSTSLSANQNSRPNPS